MSSLQDVQNGLGTLYANDPALRIVGCAKIAEGWESDVYSFTLERDTTSGTSFQELVLKIYFGNEASIKCRREMRFMNPLSRLGVPVPRAHENAVEETPFGLPFLVMERVEGRPAGEVFEHASEEEQAELISLFCRLLAELHATEWEPFAEELTFAATDDVGFIHHELSFLEGRIREFERVEFLPVLRWLRNSPQPPCRRLSVLHGDYHESNLLIGTDGSLRIIDWTGAGIGDFRSDLAWTLLLVATGESSSLRELLLTQYQQLAGFEVEQMDYFDVLAGCRRLLNMSISLSHGAESLGMRPGAEKQMMADRDRFADVYTLLTERTGLLIPELETAGFRLGRP